MQQKAVVYLIPFAHLDLFWAGSREECLSRGAEVILTALRLDTAGTSPSTAP